MEETTLKSGSLKTLESIRDALIKQEDTIVFSLIERAKFPINSPAYESSSENSNFSGSLLLYLFQETEILHAKAGRYERPEETPFFPDRLPSSLFSHAATFPQPQILHEAASNAININTVLWNMYFDHLLPLISSGADDGNYVPTVACDIACLQALSRRIHLGKFVAEAKFKESPEDYEPAIISKDKDTLMKLLTKEKVEEVVKERVKKKAMLFGEEVVVKSDDKNDDNSSRYKVDPTVVYRLYEEWVIPLTKRVEVEYLLHRLD